MTTTLEDLNNNQAAYDAAFAEDFPAPAELSEDEAFGIMPEVPAEDGASDGNSEHTGGDESAAVTLAEVPETPEEEEAQAIAGTPEIGEQTEEDEAAEVAPSPEDLQRQKSWEGRLRAREAQLAAREAELAAIEAKLKGAPMRAEGGEVTMDDLEPPGHEEAEPAMVEAVEEAAEQVQEGKRSKEQVLQALRDDFGDDFVEALQLLTSGVAEETASKLVGEKVGNVSGALEQLMSEIEDRDTRAHFQAIAKAHPDFMEVANGEAMQAYIAGLPEAERAAAQAVIEHGAAEDVVALIDAVKESANPQESHADDDTLAAAEGVRSTGMKLPEKPAQADDYAAAWNEF